jgi:type IV pilus assembly protein PilY1
MEGLGNIADNNSWSGRNNSAYLAGLAYFARTTDIRPDIPGTQTVSTYWVDVREAQTVEPPVRNQYYLATKYGGFKMPEGFDPFADSLQLDWWHTNGDTLISGVQPSVAGTSFQRPDNYFVAGEADRMVAGLTEAFAKILAEVRSSASSVAANSTRVGTDTAVFQAAFDSRRWSGELKAFRIAADGTIAPNPDWSASDQLDALTEGELATRKIFTVLPPTASGGGSFVSAGGIDFEWAALTAAQQDALRKTPNNGPLVTPQAGQDRLAFLRGSRLNEVPNGSFRERDSRLGDIVNSDPQFVHHQDFGYTVLAQSGAFTSAIADGYRTFRQSGAYTNRRPLVVVGSNDGMLHGFDAGLDANGGRELFAFVPHAAYDNLYSLALTAYPHRYFVDGAPRVADVYFNGAGWGTIAVGVTGAGGKSIFALDVTNPSTMTTADVLWEFTHPEMGNTIGQPAVAPLPNGEFAVVVTSGYTGTTNGRIWMLDPEDGSIIHSFALPNSGDLGAPLLADLNADRVADRLYVGDSNGNLWRFDLVGNSPAGWGPPAALTSGGNPLPLLVARDAGGNPQAITGALSSAFNERGDHMVFFGTGSFYQIDDNVVPVNPPVDSFYGVIDGGAPIAGRAELREQEILTEQTVNSMRVRAVTANDMDVGHKGWYLDLVWKGTYGGPGPKGERVVSRPVVRGDRVIFPTLIPNADPCSFGGDSWLMELNMFSGGRLAYAVFDTDVDDDFDTDDWITVTLPDGTTIDVPPSAVAPEIGIMDTPAVLTDDTGNENKIASGSSGQLVRVRERGSIDIGRQSWRQLR